MREKFFAALRAALLETYGNDWAGDSAKLEKFMLAAKEGRANIDSPSFVKAWRAIGNKGKPTYKGIAALN